MAQTQQPNLLDQLQDEEPPPPRFGLIGYTVLVVVLLGTTSAMNLVLWSSLGFGEGVLSVLFDLESIYMLPMAGCVMILTLLYLFDFYWPYHLPGKFFRLSDNDKFFGRALVVTAVGLAVASCLFMAKSYPSVPMLISLFLQPASVAILRVVVRPKETKLNQATIDQASIQAKMMLLRRIVGFEADIMNFLQACSVGFFFSFFVVLMVWISWATSAGGNSADLLERITFLDAAMYETDDDYARARQEMMYQLWAAPLVTAISNLVFGLFVLLRIFMQKTYSGTDLYRNQIIADTFRASLNAEIQQHQELVSKARISTVDKNSSQTTEEEAVKKRQQYLEQHAEYIKQLSLIIKIVGCTLVLVIGLMYVAGQLLYADSQIAMMVMGCLGAFFAVFAVFTYVAFKRVFDAMGQWLSELPAWKAAKSIKDSDWVRAFVLCCFLPAVPFALVLSVANQMVRKCRGIYQREFEGKSAVVDDLVTAFGKPPEQLWLTPRFSEAVMLARRWDWGSIFTKCKIFCLVYFAYTITPLCLNVGLSWLNDALSRWPFWVILVSVFMSGVVAFLLPPVPGMTVYIFGGLVVSDACPAGFWAGSVINIVLCWALKLAACAVEQKMIGETLGKRLWVRQICGVHKVAVRCIEKILRQPGLTIGKAAILCGGPDWPTSVMAGILKLSLVQCELGTLPIIGFVAPCALSGSFYLKKGETELWTNAGNMMIVLSLAVNMLLWAVAAWAIQNTLERNYEELSKPLPENIDLHWEDYKADQIKEKVTIAWPNVPFALRMVYAVAAVTQILICHAFFVGASTLFGEFKVSDKIEDLQLYGVPPKGLFSFAGVMAIGVYFLAWAPFVVFIFWERSATLDAKLELLRQLAGNEESWKEQWLKELEEPKQPVEGAPDDAKVLDRQVSRHESKESATGSTVEATSDGPHGLTKEETLVCDACTSQMYVKDDAAAILELESVKEHLSELEEAAAACQMAVSDATLECQVAEEAQTQEFSKCMVQSPKTMPALEPSPTLTAVAPGAYTASAKTSTSTSSTAAPSSVTPKARRVSAAWNAGTALEADKPYNAQEKPLAVAPQYLCPAGSCAPQCGKPSLFRFCIECRRSP